MAIDDLQIRSRQHSALVRVCHRDGERPAACQARHLLEQGQFHHDPVVAYPDSRHPHLTTRVAI